MSFSVPTRPDGSCFIVGEVGQNHDGSLGTAHAYIDAIAEAGAQAVKFQTHIAAAESTPGEPWRVKFSRQDATRFDYWKRMEFAPAHWQGLADHARDRGLVFLSSAFSFEAVDLLESIGVPAWKVGAGETSNLPMIRRMARTGKPVWLSSGMSPWEDLDRAVDTVRTEGATPAVFQCTTAYPCPPEQTGLNVIAQLRERYGTQVGLSDHSGTIYAGLAAAALGADLLEVHVTLSRHAFGPDVPASVTAGELKQLADGCKFIATALANPVDKDQMAGELSDLRDIFGKSLYAASDLAPGAVLADGHVTLRKPGTGIPARDWEKYTGRRVARAVAAGTMLQEDDFEA